MSRPADGERRRMCSLRIARMRACVASTAGGVELSSCRSDHGGGGDAISSLSCTFSRWPLRSHVSTNVFM